MLGRYARMVRESYVFTTKIEQHLVSVTYTFERFIHVPSPILYPQFNLIISYHLGLAERILTITYGHNLKLKRT